MKTHIKSVSLIFIVILTSCSSKKNENSSTSSNQTTYQSITVDCDEKNKLYIDTTFLDNIEFKISDQCQDKVVFIDTVEVSKDTLLIRNWKDVEFIVNSNIFSKPLIVNKQTFSDSLSSDLEINGFIGHPYELSFSTQDSSVTFKTPITQADSDVGDIYILKITNTGKTSVIGVEEIGFGY